MESTLSHPNDQNGVIEDPNLPKPALVARTNPKGRTIAYWTTTILVALPIGTGGVAQIAQYLGNRHGVVPVLGYPMYSFAILGFWKVLGAIAILVPRFPRLKEWAYAGIFFDLTGAAASCAAAGGYGAYAFTL